MRPGSILVLAALALAGCVQPLAIETASTATPIAGQAVSWDAAKELQGSPGDVHSFAGLAQCLATEACDAPDAPCTDVNCETRDVVVPPGAGQLAVLVRWPTDHSIWFGIHVKDASGQVVAKGASTAVDHLGAAAIVDKPAPGTYKVEVVALQGKGRYQAAARVLPEAAPESGARELLPDIVALPPSDLRIEDPPATGFAYLMVVPGEVSQAATGAMGAKGCGLDEAMNGARRCLRFSTGVANVGDGPLDIILSLQDGATSAAGGRFVQKILLADGTTKLAPAGPAEYHAVHGHWHNAAVNRNVVYAYDEATKTRGEVVKEGKKVGICFADVGVMNVSYARPDLPTHSGVECINPAVGKTWSMGLARGWFDLYDWVLSDQFVDVAGLADGTYTLCSTPNALQTLHESDPDNNEACSPFRLTGDKVERLDAAPYYESPE